MLRIFPSGVARRKGVGVATTGVIVTDGFWPSLAAPLLRQAGSAGFTLKNKKAQKKNHTGFSRSRDN